MKYIILVAISLGLTACTHSVHQVSVSGFKPIKNAKKVEGYAERVSILGFNSDNNFVDKAMTNLEKKCKRGRIVGITTEHTTSHNFFHWTDKIYLKGHCLR